MIEVKKTIKIRKEYFGCLIYNPTTRKMYYSNRTGREILSYLSDKKATSKLAILKHLEKKFPGVSRKDLRGDLDDFLKQGLKFEIIKMDTDNEEITEG